MASDQYLDKNIYSRRRLCQRTTDDKNLSFNIRNQYTAYGEEEKLFLEDRRPSPKGEAD